MGNILQMSLSIGLLNRMYEFLFTFRRSFVKDPREFTSDSDNGLMRNRQQVTDAYKRQNTELL